jgi:hypothetical protein
MLGQETVVAKCAEGYGGAGRLAIVGRMSASEIRVTHASSDVRRIEVMPATSKSTLVLVDADESTLYDYAWKVGLDNPQKAVRFVRGNKMRSVDALFDEVSAACQFRYYFGCNWAAFKECLADLSWLNCLDFLLIITRVDEVLADDRLDLSAFGRALSAAAKEHSNQTMIAKELRNTSTRSFQILMNESVSSDGNGGKLVDHIGMDYSNISLS